MANILRFYERPMPVQVGTRTGLYMHVFLDLSLTFVSFLFHVFGQILLGKILKLKK